MGEAREVMNRLTEAMFSRNRETVAGMYAQGAVIVSPDKGELKGGDEMFEYMEEFFNAFPDAKYEAVAELECGNVAVDEGRFVGTNTGALKMPDGSELPPTGKRVSVRGCDIATVENGLVVEHHLYFDQMDFLAQLGLAPQ